MSANRVFTPSILGSIGLVLLGCTGEDQTKIIEPPKPPAQTATANPDTDSTGAASGDGDDDDKKKSTDKAIRDISNPATVREPGTEMVEEVNKNTQKQVNEFFAPDQATQPNPDLATLNKLLKKAKLKPVTDQKSFQKALSLLDHKLDRYIKTNNTRKVRVALRLLKALEELGEGIKFDAVAEMALKTTLKTKIDKAKEALGES